MPSPSDPDSWNDDSEGGASFPPSTVSTADLDDYRGWARESGGWRKLLASVTGGAAVSTASGHARAAEAVSPQSLVEASSAFLLVQETLQWVQAFIASQSRAIAGEGKGWQGTAADAFLAEMEFFSKFVGAQAERIGGSSGTGGLNSLPSQLYSSANRLTWAQEQMHKLDAAWAAYAKEQGSPTDGANLTAMTGTSAEKPLTEALVQVMDSLASEYALTYNAVNPPDPGDSLTNGPKPNTVPPPTAPNLPGPGPGGGGGGFNPPPISPPGGGGGGLGGGGGGGSFNPPPISSPPGGGIGGSGTGGGGTNVPSFTPPPLSGVGGGTGGGGGGFVPPEIPNPPAGGTGTGGSSKPGGVGGGTVPPFVPPSISAPPPSGGLGETSRPPVGSGAGTGAGGVRPPVAPVGGVGGVRPPVAPDGVFKPPAISPVPEKTPLGGSGVTMPGAGAPGAPGSGQPQSGGGVSLPDAPDAGGLLEGDGSDWHVPPIGGVNIPAAPGGANPGGAGLGPMAGMPGGPGSGQPSGGGGGVSLPDAPDAGGLLEGDESHWQAPTAGVDMPAAPGGANPGGSGLSGPMPGGLPGAPAAPAGAGPVSLPEKPEKAALIKSSQEDWQSEAVEGVDAPGGTAPGVPVMGLPGVPAAGGASAPANGGTPPSNGKDTHPSAKSGRDKAPAPATEDEYEEGTKRPFGAVAPIAGVGLVAATTRRTDAEREEAERSDASGLLTEQAERWSPASAAVRVPADGDHIALVGADEQGGGSAEWDDTDGTWWLTGDNRDDERDDDA